MNNDCNPGNQTVITTSSTGLDILLQKVMNLNAQLRHLGNPKYLVTSKRTQQGEIKQTESSEKLPA